MFTQFRLKKKYEVYDRALFLTTTENSSSYLNVRPIIRVVKKKKVQIGPLWGNPRQIM